MKKTYIAPNGIRKYPKDVIAQALEEEGVSLALGLGRMLEHAGHAYTEAEIYSFMELMDAYAMTMTATDEMTWITGEFSGDAPGGAVFINEFAMGNGAAFPQPNGHFDLYAGNKRLLSFNLKKNSHLYEQNGVRAYFEVKKRRFTAYGDCFTLDEYTQNECSFVNGLMYIHIPKAILDELPRPLFGGRNTLEMRVTPVNVDKVSRRWFRLGFSPMFTLMADVYDGINAVLYGVKRPSIGGRHVYFGDIHVHSWDTTYFADTGCGRKSVKENIAYVRDVAGCDFTAITDHDWQLNTQDWEKLRRETEEANDEGRFVTLHAFEWTSSNYGHRNVYFRNIPDVLKGQEAFDYRRVRVPVKYGGGSHDNDPTPYDLFAWLKENGYEAITVPHHPNAYQFPMDFHFFFDENYDRAVEIYSNWGSMMDSSHPVNQNVERIQALGIRHYTGSGLHFGFIASSDSHDGNGGDSNVSRYKKQFGHYLGSGKVAVPADSLTRENIWQGLYSRHCYAVTGEPILLSFRIGEAVMGDIITQKREKLDIRIEAVGTDRLTRVALYKNGMVYREFTGMPGCEFKAGITDNDLEPAWYWVEVGQADSEMAWSSPIWYEPGE